MSDRFRARVRVRLRVTVSDGVRVRVRARVSGCVCPSAFGPSALGASLGYYPLPCLAVKVTK